MIAVWPAAAAPASLWSRAEEQFYGEQPPINPEDMPDLEEDHNVQVCWC